MLRIEKIMKAKGLSQAKLSRLSDVNQSSMSRILRGLEPAFPKRGQRIADALGWTEAPEKLFEEVD